MKPTRIVLLVIVVLLPAASRAEGPALPKDVRAALETNARSLTDLTIAGSRSRRMLAPAGKVLAALGTRESESEFTQPVKFELRLQGAKVHESFRFPASQYQSGNGLDEHSYDGTKYFTGSIDTSGPEKPASLLITAPAILEAEVRSKASQGMDFELWYLFEAGFSGPVHGSEIGRPIQSLVLARAAAGRIESVKDVGQGGQKLLEVVVAYPEPWASRATAPIEKDDFIQNFRGESRLLQIRMERERRQMWGQKRLVRFRLDAGMGYAVREKWESRAEGGAVMFHTTNSDFQQVEPSGLWLPRRCEVASHAYETAPRYTSPAPLYATDIQVDKLERTTFSDEQFRIWYGRPGARVSDYTHARATPGRPYSYVIASPLQDPDASQAGFSGKSHRWLFVVGLNALMAAILVSVLYVRSRRRPRGSIGHSPIG
jgi:hypothetical protein